MLSIVATPIGNLDDLSIRQAHTLLESDIILTEDTRSTGILLNEIHKRFSLATSRSPRLISYYKEKEFEKLPEIIDLLKDGKNISLISESGMPLVSDPGSLLVTHVIKNQIPFTIIPGPSAVITALIYSGLNTQQFMFTGFLPKKKSAQIRLINQWKQTKEIFPDLSIIFFESSMRIRETLQTISETLPDIRMCICREMTKKFEEVIRGTPTELMNREYKGELTVVFG